MRVPFNRLESDVYRLYGNRARVTFARRIDTVLGQARQNADDTVYWERAAHEEQWEQIAQATLVGIVEDRNFTDAPVRRWFAARGY